MPGEVRDCRKPPLPSGEFAKVPMLSSTTTVQLALNTQLTAGALTSTTVRLAEFAGDSGHNAAAAAITIAGIGFMSPSLRARRPQRFRRRLEQLQRKVVRRAYRIGPLKDRVPRCSKIPAGGLGYVVTSAAIAASALAIPSTAPALAAPRPWRCAIQAGSL